MSDAIRDLLFKRAESRWRSYAAPGFFAKLFRFLAGGRQPTAIYLVEHADADWNSMQCSEVAVRAWKQDQSGICEVPVSDVNSGEVQGHYWQNQLMRFHIARDGLRVLWNDLEGPKRGQLIVFAVQGSEAEPRLKVEHISMGL